MYINKRSTMLLQEYDKMCQSYIEMRVEVNENLLNHSKCGCLCECRENECRMSCE